VEGFLVPPHDAETLAGRIEQLYRDEETREAMGRAARVRMREFTWDAHRELLMELYRKVYRREPAPDRPL
jgi:glycosyltransferase involved in cell wall biosynthesis